MKVRETPGGFFVVLDKGEEIISALTTFARERGIRGATVTGIGALADVTLGFYHLSEKVYEQESFSGEHELVNLMGNISVVDGEPFVHAHCALGREDYSLVGGHLFSGTVAVTAEVSVRTLETTLGRERNEEIGLNLLSF